MVMESDSLRVEITRNQGEISELSTQLQASLSECQLYVAEIEVNFKLHGVFYALCFLYATRSHVLMASSSWNVYGHEHGNYMHNFCIDARRPQARHMKTCCLKMAASSR